MRHLLIFLLALTPFFADAQITQAQVNTRIDQKVTTQIKPADLRNAMKYMAAYSRQADSTALVAAAPDLSNYVNRTTAQSIAGKKTFTDTLFTTTVSPISTYTYDMGTPSRYYNNIFGSAHYGDVFTQAASQIYIGTLDATKNIRFFIGATGQVGAGLHSTTGNFFIKSLGSVGADTGERLQVTGTSKFTGNMSVAGSFLPDATNTRDIGSSSLRFANLYGSSFISSATSSAFGATGSTIPIGFRQGTATEFVGGFQGTSGNMYIQPRGVAPTDNGYKLTVDGTGAATGAFSVTGSSQFNGNATFAGSIFPDADATRSLGGASLRYVGHFVQITKPLGGGLNFSNTGGTDIFMRLQPSTNNVLIQPAGSTVTETGYKLTVDGGGATNGALSVTGNINASSAVAKGVNLSNTLTATANGDVLVALDVNPTFTVGAFTGTSVIAMRHFGHITPTVTNTLDIGTSAINYRNIFSQGFIGSGATTFGTTSGGNPVYFRQASGTTSYVGGFFPTTGNMFLQSSSSVPTDLTGYRLQVAGAMRATGNIVQGLGGNYYNYNTADETTNYERGGAYWSGNVFILSSESGGTGVVRNLAAKTQSNTLTLSEGGTNGGFFNFNRTTGGIYPAMSISGTMQQSSGAFGGGIGILPVVNQTSTAGYTMLHISPFEQATGSGTKSLIDAGTNTAANNSGTHTSKFLVTNTGAIVTPLTGGHYFYNVGALGATDYERGFVDWNTNVFRIGTAAAGTGTNRDIQLVTTGGSLSVAASGLISATRNITGVSSVFATLGNFTQSSGQGNGIGVFNTINQTGTASYNALLLSPFEQALGSGTKFLINAGTNSAVAGSGTHTPVFTLNSTGIMSSSTGGSHYFYNTADQTTNYERGFMDWNTNVFRIGTTAGGTGTNRDVQILTNGGSLTIAAGGATTALRSSSTATATTLGVQGTSSQSSSYGSALGVFPTINQSGTAGYNAIYASPFEQATGSGAKLLLNLGTNTASSNSGTHTAKLTVDNAGSVTTASTILAGGYVRATQYRLSALNTAPSSATDTGTLGEIRYDASFIYVCTATNTWVRAALSTW